MRRTIPALAVTLAVVVPVAGVVAEDHLPGAGVWVALIVAMGITKELWPARSHVDAWASGAAGEEKAARALAELGPEYVVLHDRKIPGSVANIDHVVVGPAGIFVVETKNVAGPVTVDRGRLRIAGRERAYVQQAWREAVAVQTVAAETCASLGIDVQPFLCFTKAQLPRNRTSLEGVPLLGPKGVVASIASLPERLDPRQVAQLQALLDRSLEPA